MQEVVWKLIPRRSPTCVKSLKYFMKRMVDVKNLTFAEFQKLLCRIDTLLNSRPLCANPLTLYEPQKVYPDPRSVVRKVDVFTPSRETMLHVVNRRRILWKAALSKLKTAGVIYQEAQKVNLQTKGKLSTAANALLKVK